MLQWKAGELLPNEPWDETVLLLTAWMRISGEKNGNLIYIFGTSTQIAPADEDHVLQSKALKQNSKQIVREVK